MNETAKIKTLIEIMSVDKSTLTNKSSLYVMCELKLIELIKNW